MEKYYYQIDELSGEPIITVCLISGVFGVARGIAICSESEPCFDWRRGVDRARGMATKATKHQIDDEWINRKRAKRRIAKAHAPYCCKSMWNPPLTRFEKQLLHISTLTIL